MRTRLLLLVLALTVAVALPASADTTFTGTLYYTYWCCGGNNVWDVAYNYNATTHVFSLGTPQPIAAVNGADGIIFAPNGNLLVGGQGNPVVHVITPTGTLVTDMPTGGSQSYHLALNPNGQYVYTSNFMGPLSVIPLYTGGTLHSVIGSNNSGVTQLAFAPNGNVFYVDGNPNGGGTVGLINLSTYTATPLFGNAGITPAHGMIFDPFTGLLTMFGAGYVGTFSQTGTNLQIGGPFACDFDQGAVDGQGHALVAGCNGITFMDYSASHDITHPNYYSTLYSSGGIGFGYIDDVAPLVGAGSQQGTVPEPASLLLFGTGLTGLAARLRRKKS